MSSSASSYKRITYYSWWGEDCIHPNCAEQFLYYHVASFLVFLIESLSRFDPATFKTNPTNIWFDREKSPNVKKKQGKYLQMVSLQNKSCATTQFPACVCVCLWVAVFPPAIEGTFPCIFFVHFAVWVRSYGVFLVYIIRTIDQARAF